ncbi:MAG: SPOR domain-containing protein [bacterium]|nr:SPOR domain-containing protein [bacterium]
MDNLQYGEPVPPTRKKTGIAFTGLILALVIIVAGGTFLLTQTCEKVTHEGEDAQEVLVEAPDVNPNGENTRELVFYTSEGDLVVMPNEVAEGETPKEQPLELPPELVKIMEGNGQHTETGTASTDGNVTYSVQVGAFGNPENAQGLVDKLGADGYTAYVVEPLASDEKPLYRVRVGPFHNLDEAAKTASELQEKYGLSPYIPH